jgi:CRISPR type I-E-associated protein CasA/Cse1
VSTSYPLTTSPWIPVLDGPTQREVGLVEALTRAHQLRLVGGPQEHPALLRLLLAVYDAAAGPSDSRQWAQAWAAPTLDTDRIGAYLARWAHHLDLFDPDRPAFQCGHLTEYPRGPEVIDPAFLGGRAGAWFNPQLHDPQPVEPGQAARWLLVLLGYDVAGIKAGVGGGRTYGAHVGPIASVTHAAVHGATLKDTVLLNLPPGTRAAGDAPVWERDCPPPRVVEREPAGRLDWLTWPSRRLRLQPNPDGLVTAVAWHDGDRASGGGYATAHRLDPVSAWLHGPKGPRPLPILDGQHGAPPWTAAATLLDRDHSSCAAVTHTLTAAEEGLLPAGYPLAVHLSVTLHSNRHNTVIAGVPSVRARLGTAGLLAEADHRQKLAAAGAYPGVLVDRLRRLVRATQAARRADQLAIDSLPWPWDALVDALVDDPEAARKRWNEHVREQISSLVWGLPLREFERARIEAEVFRPTPQPEPAPARRRRASSSPARSGRPRRTLTAFGESKPIAEWAADPRCGVTEATLRKRLSDGWPQEAAITTPKGRTRPDPSTGEETREVFADGLGEHQEGTGDHDDEDDC